MEHAFLDAAVFHKVVLQTVEKIAQHEVLLMDEGDGDIGNRLGAARFYRAAVKCAVVVLGAHLASLHAARVVASPLLQLPHTQVVLVVNEQLMQAGFGHIDEFKFRFARRGRRRAALGNVLFAAASRLYHLVDGAVAFVQILVGKVIGNIIDALSLLINDE